MPGTVEFDAGGRELFENFVSVHKH
jgi:hypothetical protein